MILIDSLKKKIMNPVKYAKILGVRIGNSCEIYKDVEWGIEPYLIKIGNNVRITSGCKFVTHDGGIWVLRNIREKYKLADLFGTIQIGDNVHIGLNSIIMPNVKIGNNCIIGCGSIVTKDIPDNSIAVGVPAKVIKSLDDYQKKNEERIVFTKKMSKKDKENYLRDKYIRGE